MNNIFKVFILIKSYFYIKITIWYTRLIFSIHNVNNSNSITSYGIPILKISNQARFIIGNNLVLHNEAKYAILGIGRRTKFYVGKKATLAIGHNVGISNASIISNFKISIGDNCLIGGGSIIVDSDFHSLNSEIRNSIEDQKNVKHSEVVIGKNVFIGMNSIILKGVKIGDNSIVAAGSVVSKNIPKNEIWGGNPAVCLKKC